MRTKRRKLVIVQAIILAALLLSTALMTIISQSPRAFASTPPDSTIENMAIGTDNGQVQYTGSDWTVCGGCGVDTGNDSYTYGYTQGDSFTIRFYGVEAQIWGVKESAGGIASVTLDGHAKKQVDTYSATKTSTIIYDTKLLGKQPANHTLTLTITGQKNAQSAAIVLSFDKAGIYVTPPAPVLASSIENTAAGSGNGTVQYSGSDWTVCGGCGVDTGNNSYDYAYTQGSSITIQFHGAEAQIWGVKEAVGGIASVTLDGEAEGTVDTYSATKISTIIYSTKVFKKDEDHTLTLTITGEKNPSSGAIVLSFDKADIYTYAATVTPTPTTPPTPTPTPPVTPTPTLPPYQGNAPGLSGAGTYDPYVFGTFRGTPVQVWETWNNYGTWTEMEAIQSVHLYFTGEGAAPFNVRWTGMMSFAQPLWANGETATNCANGGDDQHYINIATALKNTGYPNALIRLGWEQNGDWFWWHATSANAAQWVQCFQHAYAAFKSVSPDFVIAWNPNQTTDMAGFDTRTTYPGDNYVDVIAVDFYDHYPNYPDQAAWDAEYNATESSGSPAGMGAYIYYATLHNKPLAFPEWGLDTNNSFDNPFYIQKMAETFATLRSYGQLYWESYFNLNDGCTFKITDGCNPNASAEYVQLF